MLKVKYNEEESKHLFFTSDTHFDHTNIIKFCNRPYETVDEMNNDLVERWNSKVTSDDTVFHLGDFCFAGSAEWKNWRNKLNGNIILIRGNHDRKMSKSMETLFDGVYSQLQLKIDGQDVYLNHYPFLTYAGCWRTNPTWQLFGHVHSGMLSSEGKDMSRLEMLFPYQYDVGVDNNNFTPISWEDVKIRIKNNIEFYGRN